MKKILFIFIIAALICLPLFAGTTGKLAGKVRDEDGNPVIANIVIDGSQMGAQSKANGQFIIINIPPGTYNIRCMAMGYGTQLVEGLEIFTDQTSTQNFTLSKDAMKLDEVVVKGARKQDIKKDKTGSGRAVTAATIEDIGAESINDIVAIQAGAVTSDGELHVRGGRSNEINYTIDGMSVSDPVDGGAALEIDEDAIANMDVMTGGLTAEYGNAMSGMVNIVTKSGSDIYSGKIEANTDHAFSDKDETSNNDQVKFTLGGPLFGFLAPSLSDDLTFFMNGAAQWSDSRYRKYYVNDPNDDIPELESDYSGNDPYADREEFGIWDLGNRNFNLYNANLKIKYKINPTQNVTVAVRGDVSNSIPYSHNWRYALEHYFETEQVLNQYILTYDHLFNPQMNLKVKASAFSKSDSQQPRGIDREDYFVLGDATEWEKYYLDINGRNTTGINILDPEEDGVVGEGEVFRWEYLNDGTYSGIGDFTSPGSIAGTYIDDSSTQYSLRSDFEYQVNAIHGLKTGIEVVSHHIEKDRLFNPWSIDPYRYNEFLKTCDFIEFVAAGDSIDIDGDGIKETEVAEDTYFYSQEDNYRALKAASGSTDGYRADPWQAAYYLQDRMEWEGMIVNAGMRFDFWYLGEEYEILKEDGSYRKREFADDEKMQLMVSPRLGVSHPISDQSVVHFAYNYQNQLPQFQYIFTTADSTDAYTSNDNIVVGNPQLEPQITVTYEVGLQHQLSESYVMDITAYYKNIYNYVSTHKVYKQGDETVYWYEYISEDYGSARGIDINLSRSLSNFVSGSASYSLSWANGNNSSTVIQDETTNLAEFPLDWDIRHSGNLNVSFKVMKDEEFYLPVVDWLVPFDDFNVTFNYSVASGAPYTPVNEDDTQLDINSANRPYTSDASLKMYKRFSLGERSTFKIYFNINNLFDKINYYGVYAKTGDPYDDGAYKLNPDGDGYVDDDGEYVSEATYNIHQLALYNPGRASSGRTYTLGVSYNW